MPRRARRNTFYRLVGGPDRPRDFFIDRKTLAASPPDTLHEKKVRSVELFR